jgi:hypothetical protein
MNLEGELRREANAPEGGRALGEAANRWVTFQMIMAVVGVCIFLFMLFFFFIPLWNRFPGF